MRMDWKSEGNTLRVYPDNLYLLKVSKWEYHTASTGKQQIRWNFVIQGGDHDGEPYVDHMVLTEKALWRVGQLVSCCGIDTSGLPEMETESKTFNKVLDLCVGCKVYAQIKTSEYNNKMKNEVESYSYCDDQPTVDASANMNSDLPPHLRGAVDEEETIGVE